MARRLHYALELARRLSAGEAPEVPVLAQRVVKSLADQIGALQVQLAALERELLAGRPDNVLSVGRGSGVNHVSPPQAIACAPATSVFRRFTQGFT